MAQVDNLNSDVVKEIFKRLHKLDTAVANNPTVLGTLPTTTNPPNIYQDPGTGQLYRSTA